MEIESVLSSGSDYILEFLGFKRTKQLVLLQKRVEMLVN